MKIVKITAIWCSSCIIVNNILDELKAEYELNIDELDYD
ncbi:MAG: thiol reductase thioredoxin, partial [Mollicutes bacterium]|nr:thiol reductase thioredoxin [Mollicutes bacterium]